ncbi:HNH endonuclease [Paraburkholderia sp. LEh10]|uniref:HNH endonuclease n=1 Tax=Paraburkholderia sp. LEh10 TaxID=2821353 RepID=UPI001AE8947D|nr:HNH endonuclease [Paraburkholderia sp. LEh10]MBP0594570.1 HNH endonuclease [Paraburkholderia sp. LEh10]
MRTRSAKPESGHLQSREPTPMPNGTEAIATRSQSLLKARTYDFSGMLSPKKGFDVSRKEILNSLRDCAKMIGSRRITIKQYDAWPHRVLSSHQIAVRFSGWDVALKEAGLEVRATSTGNAVEMVEIFLDCWEDYNDVPTVKNLSNHLKKINSKFSISMYTRYFGGVRRLAIQIVKYNKGEISENQLLDKYFRKGANRGSISAKLRYMVFVRDQFTCVSCGRSVNRDGVRLEIDHKVPVSTGGTSEFSNLQTLCIDCNRGKGDAAP